MLWSRVLVCAGLCASAGAIGSLRAQTAGVSAEWDTRTTLQSLADQAQKLKPILESVQPKEWLARGASPTYVEQWQKANNEIGYLVGSSKLLSQQPEKLTAALDTLYRLENLSTLLHSVAEGVRKYQNPAVADLIDGIATSNFTNREKLRQYIMDLANQKEQEFAVIDKEAQRCRAEISSQPNRPAAASRSRNTSRTEKK